MASPERILYVTDGISPWVVGGMQAVARRHAGWLSEAGFDVTVVASRAEMPDNVDFASRLVNLPWPKGSLVGKLSPSSYTRELTVFSKAVCEVVDKVAPDLIYAEGPLVDAYLSRKTADRVPVIFHPHGLEMFQDTGSTVINARLRPMRPLMRRLIEGAAFTISQGGRLDQILAGPARAPVERITYLPNCTPAGFRFAETARRRHAGRFLFVGRNEVRKGLPLLLSAIANVSGAHLHIVGETGRNIKAQDRVTFNGSVRDREKLRAFFEEADFLVVPSYAEGMPTVILEAFSAALPVIATDVGAVAALVRNGESGYLVPRADREALAAALVRAVNLPNGDYEQLSARALELATTEFSPERIRQMLLDIVNKVFAGRVDASLGRAEGTIQSMAHDASPRRLS